MGGKSEDKDKLSPEKIWRSKARRANASPQGERRSINATVVDVAKPYQFVQRLLTTPNMHHIPHSSQFA
jgi:hypothetical protein